SDAARRAALRAPWHALLRGALSARGRPGRGARGTAVVRHDLRRSAAGRCCARGVGAGCRRPDAAPRGAVTFSIIARDPKSAAFGVAVCTAVPCVGAIVPHAKSGVGAIATQSYSNIDL